MTKREKLYRIFSITGDTITSRVHPVDVMDEPTEAEKIAKGEGIQN